MDIVELATGESVDIEGSPVEGTPVSQEDIGATVPSRAKPIVAMGNSEAIAATSPVAGCRCPSATPQTAGFPLSKLAKTTRILRFRTQTREILCDAH